MRFPKWPLSVPLLFSAALCLSRASSAAADPGATYVPDPEIEKLIEQAAKADKLTAQNALSRLAGLGGAAERALMWHVFHESDLSAKARWAEVLARLSRGGVAYRVTLELQPDGSGLLTLWSNRALLAQCAKRYDHLLDKPERDFDLKDNLYSKGALFDSLNDGVKHLEGRVEVRGEAVEALGLLSFKNFDALVSFADKFDLGGYYMLAGATLSDSAPNLRTYRFKKMRETARERCDKNLLLFCDVQWEFVLDFKGRITNSNAVKTDGSKLVWTFNCYQMAYGQAQVEASFDAAGLPPRLAKEDHALPLPDVVQASQPLAIVRQGVVRAKVFRRTSEPTPTARVLRERGQLVELDGRDSLPHGANLQYRWTQTYGGDLKLTAVDLSQPRLCMVINEPAEYGFELVVSNGGAFSKPAEVKVIVQETEATTAANPVALPPASTAALPPAPSPAPPVPPTPAAPPKTVAAGENSNTSQRDTADATVSEPLGRPKELYAAGEKLMKAFQYAEARKTLAAAAVLAPENQDCQFQLGVALLECGEVAAALARFEDLAEADNTGRAAMYAGHCNARCGNMPEAGRWYRKGATLGKEKVSWEQLWGLGWLDLAGKDYERALRRLTDAEKAATAGNVKDYRLLRDLARALHGCHKDDEALRKLAALQELGYTPDAQFVTEVKKGLGASPAAAGNLPPPQEPKPATTELKPVAEARKPPAPEPKTDLSPVAGPPEPKPVERPLSEAKKPLAPEPKTDVVAKTPEPKPVEQPRADAKKPPTPVQSPQSVPAAPRPNAEKFFPERPEAKKESPDNSAIAEAVDLTNPRPAKKPEPKPTDQSTSRAPPERTTPNLKPSPPAHLPTLPLSADAPKPENPQPSKKTEPEPREDTRKAPTPAAAESTGMTKPPTPAPLPLPPSRSGEGTGAGPKNPPQKTKPPPPAKPPRPPPPPVPDDFDKALAAGKLVCDDAARLTALKTPEAKVQAACACDVAEAMLQGAWAKRPGDKAVLAAFAELSKYVNVIAIASNPVIKAKVRGLVVLDAAQSIVPKGKPMYCVWEQVDGEKLPLRPEDLSQKKVGLRIPCPGIYKFELAVSDGSLGGNPVTVTVEVVE